MIALLLMAAVEKPPISILENAVPTLESAAITCNVEDPHGSADRIEIVVSGESGETLIDSASVKFAGSEDLTGQYQLSIVGNDWTMTRLNNGVGAKLELLFTKTGKQVRGALAARVVRVVSERFETYDNISTNFDFLAGHCSGTAAYNLKDTK